MNPNKQIGPNSHAAPNLPHDQAGIEYRLLAGATRKILEEKDLYRILQTICEEACRVFGADRSLVAKIGTGENPRRIVLSSYNVPHDFVEAYEASQTKSIFHEALQDRRLKVISDFMKESKVFSPELIRHHGLRAACVIPLIVEGTSVGALVLYHLTPKKYKNQDLQLAEAFGDLTSLAIEKAQLIQKKRPTGGSTRGSGSDC